MSFLVSLHLLISSIHGLYDHRVENYIAQIQIGDRDHKTAFRYAEVLKLLALLRRVPIISTGALSEEYISIEAQKKVLSTFEQLFVEDFPAVEKILPLYIQLGGRPEPVIALSKIRFKNFLAAESEYRDEASDLLAALENFKFVADLDLRDLLIDFGLYVPRKDLSTRALYLALHASPELAPISGSRWRLSDWHLKNLKNWYEKDDSKMLPQFIRIRAGYRAKVLSCQKQIVAIATLVKD